MITWSQLYRDAAAMAAVCGLRMQSLHYRAVILGYAAELEALAASYEGARRLA